MSKKFSKQKEFDALLKFVDFYASNYLKIDPKSKVHPSNVCKSIAEKVGPSKAFQGLKMAVNDIVNMTFDFDTK